MKNYALEFTNNEWTLYHYDEELNNLPDIKGNEINKYFNLPKFKEWWDKADYDEYYVTECEYEGSCGTGYHPLSEKEWRAQQKEE